MLEAVAFLIFASAIWYVVIWSVRNDDRVPRDERKRKFGHDRKPRPADAAAKKSLTEPKK